MFYNAINAHHKFNIFIIAILYQNLIVQFHLGKIYRYSGILRQIMTFWAKTLLDGSPGISVFDHCVNVGSVASRLISHLPQRVGFLLPEGAATLAALHDIGKITLGFQAKSTIWMQNSGLDSIEASYSVSDHALVSQVHLQSLLKPFKAHLWAAAVGAHHGKPKGRFAQLQPMEYQAIWAESHRNTVTNSLITCFGPLTKVGPSEAFGERHSDLWLLAGLITVADWIGSNEKYFSPLGGLTFEQSSCSAVHALV